MEKFEQFLIKNNNLNGDIQKIYRFENGYGASVVKSRYSYGGKAGFWEIAVIEFNGDNDDYELCYNTPITDNVIGWLAEGAIDGYLEQIKNLQGTNYEKW